MQIPEEDILPYRNYQQLPLPFLGIPFSGYSYVENVELVPGTNIIPHTLSHPPTRWIITSTQQGAVIIYRNAAFNGTSLSLFSSAPATISIGVI